MYSHVTPKIGISCFQVALPDWKTKQFHGQTMLDYTKFDNDNDTSSTYLWKQEIT